MRKYAHVLAVALGSLAAAVVISGQSPVPPPWAYGYNAAGPDPAPPPCPREAKPLDCARLGAPRPNDVVHKLPGADRTFTEFQIHYDYGPADAYPGDHPPMPDIVSRGRESDTIRACGLCHYPNGHGRPENGSPAGLPAAYILQQLDAFRNGTRRSADPRKANANEMIQIARHLTEAEMKIVAEYFSSITRRPWVKVVETETVPKTRAGVNGLFLPVPGNDTEPLGKRIIEVPESTALTEPWRSPRSGWVAYVPVGSMARGEEIVTQGGGRTVQCTLCHGQDLKGIAAVPRLAGMHPVYTARQLMWYKDGTRAGLDAPLMKPWAATLNVDDIIAVSAYLATIAP